jgi:hypothetical protein
MPHVLVVTDTPDGSVPKPVQELLTLARRLGDPAVVALGPGAGAAAGAMGRFGAARVYVIDDPILEEYIVVPKAEAVAHVASLLREDGGPAAVLIPATPEGQELAGRDRPGGGEFPMICPNQGVTPGGRCRIGGRRGARELRAGPRRCGRQPCTRRAGRRENPPAHRICPAQMPSRRSSRSW